MNRISTAILWITILVVLLIAILCADGATWEGTQWNDGVSVKQTETGFKLIVPSGNGHVNSVQRSQPAPKPKQTVTVKYRLKTVSGKPRFTALDRGGPANFSVMLARVPLDGRLYVSGVNYVKLQEALDKGERTYSVKLTPDLWQDVNGKQNAGAFKSMLNDVRLVQIVFGGKFRAHGVTATGGKARFNLTGFTIK